LDRFIHKQSIECKYCNSSNIVKYGTFQAMQRYFCKNCHRKFADNDALPKMKTPVWIISLALNCYYEGMSLGAIQREINQQHGAYYAQSSIYNWIVRFSEEAVRQAKLLELNVSDIWLLCITPIRTGNRLLWFWDIFDTNNKFLISSRLSETGTRHETLKFINATYLVVKKQPRYPVTILLSNTPHIIQPIRQVKESELSNKIFFKKADEDSVKPFYRLLKKRNNVVHIFRSINKAQILTDAWIVHYNYLKGSEKTKFSQSAQKMDKMPFKNWGDIIRQSIINK
jgi:putative transposase